MCCGGMKQNIIVSDCLSVFYHRQYEMYVHVQGYAILTYKLCITISRTKFIKPMQSIFSDNFTILFANYVGGWKNLDKIRIMFMLV